MTTIGPDPSSFPFSTSASERRVGVPIQEAVLTGRLLDAAGRLFRPGPGRTSWLLLEPKTGFGIPDALVITASESAVSAHVRRQLRLPSVSAARALTNASMGTSGLSERYARSLRRELQEAGWDSRAVRKSASVIHDSLAIEVKLRDARRALQQINKFRVSANRTALVMPATTARNISTTSLRRLGAGLIVAEADSLQWHLSPQHQVIDSYRKLWLTELLVRGIETNRAYKLSAARKVRIDSKIAATRLE